MQKLNFASIESSSEIQEWLKQLPKDEASTAKSLLCNLEFISRDVFSNWLIKQLEGFADRKCALYTIRKFDKEVNCLWDKFGKTEHRPAATLGSEDLVASVVSNANRAFNNPFLDHPSLTQLRDEKITDIVLVDDSIGSGKRVSDYLTLMTKHRSFMSWWSYGWIRLHIISYAQTHQSIKLILDRIPGSDHGKRKYRTSDKISFINSIKYDQYDLQSRWGVNHKNILKLCQSVKKIDKNRRKGFGGVMGNIVFYHSVPNNIPGMLYSRNKGWSPLFPNRALPGWLIKLLDISDSDRLSLNRSYVQEVPEDILHLLRNIKSGIRNSDTLSKRMGYGNDIIDQLIEVCINAGLLTRLTRLSPAGDKILRRKRNIKNSVIIPDYSLYIPITWRTD